jgi:quercetin dioxygenase-like cupin family protein
MRQALRTLAVMKSILFALASMVLVTCITSCMRGNAANAPDPVKSDPQHHKVEFENDHIRVLRVKYGPHEKSPMHSHPGTVTVGLTDSYLKQTIDDGKPVVGSGKAGGVGQASPLNHSVENLSDGVFEVIVIELKDEK